MMEVSPSMTSRGLANHTGPVVGAIRFPRDSAVA